MFQPTAFYQPAAATPHHMYMEPHQLPVHHSLRTQPPLSHHGRYIQQQQQQQTPAVALPSLITAPNKNKQFHYHPYHTEINNPRQLSSSPRSPTSCYSPSTAVSLDGTVADFAAASSSAKSMIENKSPALSCTSSKTASPVPLAALAAAASAEHSQVLRRSAPTSPSAAQQQQQEQQQQQQQPARRRRGGRGSRSMYTAEEKEMRRKISHSAIEKRRRERTNNVLRDLQDMVPWLSKSNKVQKLEILEAAAQYIKELCTSSGAASGSAALCQPRARDRGQAEDDEGMDDEDIDDEVYEAGSQPGEDAESCCSSSSSSSSSHAASAMDVNFLLS
ncbi:hypothetical protein J3B02_005322 [Coemansia erecta]|nr:hypothetical protein J3B02_005322 [Coemansia erecta]KAJ2874673.1 hypothetical protein FB639_004076 [Coemansia asiatica]